MQRKHIILCKVTVHIGIMSKKAADKAARKATDMSQLDHLIQTTIRLFGRSGTENCKESGRVIYKSYLTPNLVLKYGKASIIAAGNMKSLKVSFIFCTED